MLRVFDFEIKYVNTNDFGQADALSRLIQNTPQPDEDLVIAKIRSSEAAVNQCFEDKIRRLPVTAQHVQEHTLKDKSLQHVMKYIRVGWPEQRKRVPEELRAYWERRMCLSVI